MKLIPIFKNKKGIALESAVLFMTIIFSFCFLLSSLALCGHYQVKIEEKQMELYLTREQIGENFLAYLNQEKAAPKDFDTFLKNSGIYYKNYTCEEIKTQGTNKTQYQLIVSRVGAEDTAVILYMKAEKTAQGQVTLLSWLPNLPGTDET
ncbi:MAG: hypothetical protein E7293_10105 [Lachnospiraceae bacterium]|nr:hypothetical protein [Lachnospiraceae bacterium]